MAVHVMLSVTSLHQDQAFKHRWALPRGLDDCCTSRDSKQNSKSCEAAEEERAAPL
ncbi:hypothetical protein Mapa_016202 [Marchantia paleacea]|nr:hypothetical protein Mapa_016202 [Marchantia paleacea]